MKSIIRLLLFSAVFAFGCSTQPQKTILPDLSTQYQIPAGKPATLIFASYKTTMIANGTDEVLLRISVADSSGMEIMDSEIPFEISVKGDATITETEGTSTELVSQSDTMTVWKSKLENGIKTETDCRKLSRENKCGSKN